MKQLYVSLTLLMFLVQQVQGQNKAGILDNSFGNNGFVSGKKFGELYTIIQQNDGKLLAAGGFTDLNASIIRLLNDGTLDSSFGNNGGTTTNVGLGASKMLLTADGKILISDIYRDDNYKIQSYVAKFTTDGKLDSSFGINGISIIPMYNSSVSYNQMALTPDGSIIVGGGGVNDDFTQYSVTSKLSTNGIFDSSFGNNGYAFNSAFYYMKDLAVQPDGKIVSAGQTFGYNFLFSRYNSDGSLDNSFGKDGNEIFTIGGYGSPEKIIIQPNGKLMIGGVSSEMCALRLNANGSLDETFGDSGKALIDFKDSHSWAYDMVQQPDGKFILAGGASLEQTGGKFALCRITNDGKLDSSFGVNGLQTTAFSDNSNAYCAALQSDGKIVLGGFYSRTNDDGDVRASYLIARYNNEFNKKQMLIAKIRRSLQHHNGIVWDNLPGIKSYTVQRSADGGRWTTVQSQQSTVNSQSSIGNAQLSTVNYYNDASPLPGTNYYRLQTTSVDGIVAYSNVIAINNEPLTISLAPNPIKNVLRIEGLSSSNKIKISVVDLGGNVACSVQLIANSSSYNLNIAALKPGNYWLKLEVNGEVITKQFVKE
jgi:uncharacterized delta-60 repeat protein